LGFGIQEDHSNGAIAGAESAADAKILVYAHNALVISVDCLYRADVHAIGIFTLVADPGKMIEGLCLIFYNQTGKPRIIPLEQVKGTGQLADAAPGAFVKMCMDKGVDGCLLGTISSFWELKISHIRQYANPCF
jgi:hypothetical protein